MSIEGANANNCIFIILTILRTSYHIKLDLCRCSLSKQTHRYMNQDCALLVSQDFVIIINTGVQNREPKLILLDVG